MLTLVLGIAVSQFAPANPSNAGAGTASPTPHISVREGFDQPPAPSVGETLKAAVGALPLNRADVIALSPKGFANGGTIRLPRGRHVIRDCPIVLTRGTRIVGDGRESTQIVSRCAGSVFRYLDSGRYVPDEIAFENLSIWQDDGTPATSGAAIEVDTGPAATQSVALYVSNVLIEGTYHGILLQAGLGSSVRDAVVTKTVSHGVYVRYGGANPTATTSSTFANVYASLSRNGDGFRFEGSPYVSCISCASDSNARHGYSIEGGGAVELLASGAEMNGEAGVSLRNTNSAGLSVQIVAGPGLRHGVLLENAGGVVVRNSTFHSDANTAGFAFRVLTPKPLVVIGATYSGAFSSRRVDDPRLALFVGGWGSGGFQGGIGNTWTLGAANEPDRTAQLAVVGNAEPYVSTGVRAAPTFTTASPDDNVALEARAIAAGGPVTYSAVIGARVASGTPGAGTTIDRLAGVIIEDQTAGAFGNTNLVVGKGSPPPGNWSLYSDSRKDNFFRGPLRFASPDGPLLLSGRGSPEGILSSPVGSVYLRSDGGSDATLYVKESGTGSTGWVAK